MEKRLCYGQEGKIIMPKKIPTLAEARQLQKLRLKILKLNKTKFKSINHAERIGRNTRLAYVKLEKLERKIYARIKKSNKRK